MPFICKYVIISTLNLKKCRPSGGTFYFFCLVWNSSGNSSYHGKIRFRSSGFGKVPILRSSFNPHYPNIWIIHRQGKQLCHLPDQAWSFNPWIRTLKSSGGHSGITSIRILLVIKIRTGDGLVFKVSFFEISFSVGIFAKIISVSDCSSNVFSLRIQ